MMKKNSFLSKISNCRNKVIITLIIIITLCTQISNAIFANTTGVSQSQSTKVNSVAEEKETTSFYDGEYSDGKYSIGQDEKKADNENEQSKLLGDEIKNGIDENENNDDFQIEPQQTQKDVRSKTAMSISGSGTNGDPFVISTADDLKAFRDEVNNGNTQYANSYWVLNNDIDLNNEDWVPIGKTNVNLLITHTDTTASPRGSSSYTPFKGVFDGKGHTISNLNVQTAWSATNYKNDYKGLFGMIEDAAVIDVNIDNASVDGGAATGTLVGYAYGKVTITNCKISNTEIKSRNFNTDSNFGIGGLLGIYDVEETTNAHDLVISKCSVTNIDMDTSNAAATETVNKVAVARTGAGGMVGMVRAYSRVAINGSFGTNANIRLENVAVQGNVLIKSGVAFGGVLGYIYLNSVDGNTVTIDGVKVSDAIFTGLPTSRDVGGVTGCFQIAGSSDNTFSIKDPDVKLSLDMANSMRIGGIIGYTSFEMRGIDNKKSVDNTLNIVGGNGSGASSHGSVTGKVNGSRYAGGVIGMFQTSANASGGNIDVDGIDADVEIKASKTASYSDFTGNSGGIAGCINFANSQNGEMKILNCTSSGNVSLGNEYYGGGILGIYLCDGSSNDVIGLIDNCHASGDVISTGEYGYYIGGVIGFSYIREDSKNAELTLSNCSASGEVAGQYYNGGLAGYLEMSGDGAGAKTAHTYVSDCHATGDVSSRTTFAGGLIGHGHGGNGAGDDAIVVTNSWASGDVRAGIAVTSEQGGGFIGYALKGMTFKNCYATGDVYGSYYYNGGFVGFSASDAGSGYNKFENCYATGNVYGKSYGNGGFGGWMNRSKVKNCYATGSVKSPATNNGGFAGYASGPSSFENCFSSGTISGGGGTNGFVGTSANGTSTYTNCFYDTTTSTMASGGAPGITGKSTKDMIDPQTFANWDALNVWHVSLSNNQRDAANPWYIDKDATYPYLYYQADGFDTDGDGKGDGYLDSQKDFPTNFNNTNYFLGALYYNDLADGSSAGDKIVPDKRYDFSFPEAKGLNFKAMTVGADRAYFPYAYTTGISDYNLNQFWFEDGIKNSDTDGPDWVNTLRAGKKNFAANQKISFGAYSKTNVLAFSSGPFAIKTNMGPVWEKGGDDSKTYSGNKITYKIEYTNYSNNGDWKNIQTSDPLAKGVSLTNDFVFLYKDGVETKLEDYTGKEKPKTQEELDGEGNGEKAVPYYTYEPGSSGSEYEGRYILKLFNLPELEYARVENEKMNFDTFYIEFVAQVSDEAVTPQGNYPEDYNISPGEDALKNYKHDNIRNKADVTGTMHLWNPEDLFKPVPEKKPLIDENGNPVTHDVNIKVDDKDKDPVYKDFTVTYSNNFRAVDSKYTKDTVLYKDYLLSDGSKSHTVIPNDDPNDPQVTPHKRKDFAGFDSPSKDYDFDGWFYFKTTKAQDDYENRSDQMQEPPSDQIVTITLEDIQKEHIIDPRTNNSVAGRDIRLYAIWKLNTIYVDFQKINQNNDPIKGAKFDLYYWTGNSDPVDADSYITTEGTGSNVGNGKWEKQNSSTDDSCTSKDDGMVTLAFDKTGIYQLKETEVSSKEYYLPEVQWRFDADVESSPMSYSSPKTIKKNNTVFPIDFAGSDDEGWTLTNYLLNSILIQKNDNNGQLLDGAVFAIERYIGGGDPKADNDEANWKLVYQGETGKDGNGKGVYQFGKNAEGVNTMSPGQYRFKEVKTPPGYTQLKKPIHFVLPLEDDLSSLNGTEKQEAIDNAQYTNTGENGTVIYGFTDLTYKVGDTVEFELPYSGLTDHNLYWLLLALILIDTAASLKFYHDRKAKQVNAS